MLLFFLLAFEVKEEKILMAANHLVGYSKCSNNIWCVCIYKMNLTVCKEFQIASDTRIYPNAYHLYSHSIDVIQIKRLQNMHYKNFRKDIPVLVEEAIYMIMHSKSTITYQAVQPGRRFSKCYIECIMTFVFFG